MKSNMEPTNKALAIYYLLLWSLALEISVVCAGKGKYNVDKNGCLSRIRKPCPRCDSHMWVTDDSGFGVSGNLEVDIFNGSNCPTNGIIQTPIEPPDNEYPAYMSIRYELRAPIGKVISVAFDQQFDFEDLSGGVCFDYVTFTDDPSALGTQCDENNKPKEKFDIFCGNRVPDAFVTQSNRLVVELCSDSGDEGVGAKLTWKIQDA